jgi:hypothetical protein
MNIRIKIFVGILAGLIAGAPLVGTAVAAPRMMAGTTSYGYGMMRSSNAPGTFDRPTIAEMNAFMNRYRTADGSIDFGRMHSDVTSGKVTPPCLDGTARAKTSSRTPGGQPSARRGPAMMRGWRSNGGPATGYGMMGSTY